jgi:hypothetical protein
VTGRLPAGPDRRRWLRAMARLASYNLRLVVGPHWWLYLVALAGWLGILVARVLLGWNEGPWQPWEVQNTVLSVPMTPLAIQLGMMLLYYEIENRTMETTLSIAGGEPSVWLLKIGTALAFLAAPALVLAALAYLFLVPFPLVPVVAHALVPLLFYFALALMLSLLLRGEIASGMVAALVLAVNLLGGEGLKGSLLNPFLNYLDPPAGKDVFIDREGWLAVVVQNRVAVVLASVLMIAYSLHRLRDRERLV